MVFEEKLQVRGDAWRGAPASPVLRHRVLLWLCTGRHRRARHQQRDRVSCCSHVRAVDFMDQLMGGPWGLRVVL